VIAEQERMAYLLDLREVPHDVIAQRLEISVGTVKNRIKAGREARTRDDADELRDHIDDQYREDYRTVSLMLAATEDPDLKLKCVAQRVNISKERRKLNAVDRPTPLETALIGRAEVESQLIATAVQAAIEGVVTAADVDAAFAQKLREYAFELAARELERVDGGEPTGPAPEPPKPQLAITAGPGAAGTAGSPEGPSGKIDDEGGPSAPHPRSRDSATTILAQVDRILMEDDDDEDEEDDQG
jgi:hypothetical protein